MARQLARRRQRERTAGALVVALGVLVLGVALFALREPNGHVSATHSASSDVAKHTSGRPGRPARSKHSSTSTGGGTHQAAHRLPLVVLNDSPVQGLAARAAHTFEAGGWHVTSFGNYQNDIASTCAYYDPASAGAQAAAQALQAQYPAIKRVQPRFVAENGAQPLPSAPVVVVLTGDYSAQ